MNNPIARHIYRLIMEPHGEPALNQRHGLMTRGEFIARLTVDASEEGDMIAVKIICDTMDCFDPAMADVEEEDDE